MRHSGSSLASGHRCLRYWSIGRMVPRLEGEATEGQKLGTALHSMQEAYLTEGTRQDEIPCPEGTDAKLWRKAARLAVAGMRHLPGPKTGGVEGEFEFSADQMRFRGFMDYNGTSEKLPNFRTPDAAVIPVALDHKTSSDPSQYGLWGKDAFLKDPQAVVYAYKLLIEAGAEYVGLRWVYYWSKSKEKTLPSDVILTREEVLAAWQSLILPMARHQQLLSGQIPTFVDLAATADWAQRIAPNPHKCADYGGCEYRKITEAERTGAVTKNKHVHPYRGACVLTDSEQAVADLTGLNDIIPTETLTRKVSPKMATAPDLFQALQGAFAGNGNGAAKPPAAVLNPPEAPTAVAVTKGPDLMEFLRTAQGSDVPVAASAPAAAVPQPPKKPSVRPPAPVAKVAAPVAKVVSAKEARLITAVKDELAQVDAEEAARKAAPAPIMAPLPRDVDGEPMRSEPDTSFNFGANVLAEPRTLSDAEFLAERIATELSTQLHLTPAQVVDRAFEIAQLLAARFTR